MMRRSGKKSRQINPASKVLVLIALTLLAFAGNSSAVPCQYALPGDLNYDCKVNIGDLSIMAANWLTDCDELPLDSACVDYIVLAQDYQYHGIETGLEIFKTEFGIYPESSDNVYDTFPTLGADPNTYLGANKLAEAMVGMDLMGFHPDSGFRSDGLSEYTSGLVYTDTPENFDERRGPFIDLENANVFRLEDIYEDVGPFNGSTLVLCDVYEKERHSDRKTGMPVLFFRARTQYIAQDYTDGIEDDIYYYPDNQALLELGSAEDQTIQHPLSDGAYDWQDFENMILNLNITAIKRPYRADSFILISAGPDGLYGTEDDVLNFETEIIE